MEIFLMAASKKYHNYCVAGINVKSRQMVRVTSKDPLISYAIKKEDFLYADGGIPKIFDIVSFEEDECVRQPHHPENVAYKPCFGLRKIRSVSIKDLGKFEKLPCIHDKSTLFYNLDRKINIDEMLQIPNFHRYSLAIAVLSDFRVLVEKGNGPNGKKFSARFKYKNREYRNISITDLEFMERYRDIKTGLYTYEDSRKACFFSLGEPYHNCLYKLIASVYEFDDVLKRMA